MLWEIVKVLEHAMQVQSIYYVDSVAPENCTPKFTSVSGSPKKDPPENAEVKYDFLVRHFCLLSFSCLLSAAFYGSSFASSKCLNTFCYSHVE